MIPLAICQECHGPLPPAARTGRPRKWCSERCRDRRRQRRRARTPFPPIAPLGYPSDPESVRRRTADAIVGALAGDAPAPAPDQAAQAIHELRWLAFRLERIQRDLPPRIGGRIGAVGRGIRDLLARHFPEQEVQT